MSLVLTKINGNMRKQVVTINTLNPPSIANSIFTDSTQLGLQHSSGALDELCKTLTPAAGEA